MQSKKLVRAGKRTKDTNRTVIAKLGWRMASEEDQHVQKQSSDYPTCTLIIMTSAIM